MKTIYLFQYQFDPCPSVHSSIKKRGLLNYKTFIIVRDNENPNLNDSEEFKFAQSKKVAVNKFKEKFPHVDLSTVNISIFNGDIIDSCEPAE
jgi:hypothetical protein